MPSGTAASSWDLPETFSFEGQRYSFKDVKITPGYVQPGGPPLWIAATTTT